MPRFKEHTQLVHVYKELKGRVRDVYTKANEKHTHALRSIFSNKNY